MISASTPIHPRETIPTSQKRRFRSDCGVSVETRPVSSGSPAMAMVTAGSAPSGKTEAVTTTDKPAGADSAA